LHILDIAQNSVKANATIIKISVDIDTASDRLTISVEDNGCGMTAEQLAKATDPFYTTRTTRKVGLGIPFFKMAAEMSGGSFDISSAKGKGTTVTAVFGYSHIDRLPLGDIAATVCSLIQLNSGIDFIYSYSYNGKGFTADTREFKSILQNVPINAAEVLTFIKHYINENSDLASKQ